MTAGLARSVETRLVRHAHALEIDPNIVLARYAAERLLCSLAVEPDAVEFDPESIRVAPIRPLDTYGGQRVALVSHLGSARLRVQVDVGVGDSVVPEPEWIDYPSLLDLPRPRLRAYRPETTVAEKLHAMVELDAKNSRMRDFFDLHALAARWAFDGAVLAAAIAATFGRRETAIPRELPLALTRGFAEVDGKTQQWRGFARRLSGAKPAPELVPVLDAVAAFAGPVLLAVGRGEPFERSWHPGGPWQ